MSMFWFLILMEHSYAASKSSHGQVEVLMEGGTCDRSMRTCFLTGFTTAL